jgi:hypothetical protein
MGAYYLPSENFRKEVNILLRHGFYSSISLRFSLSRSPFSLTNTNLFSHLRFRYSHCEIFVKGVVYF